MTVNPHLEHIRPSALGLQKAPDTVLSESVPLISLRLRIWRGEQCVPVA